jgi:hypothetical protein
MSDMGESHEHVDEATIYPTHTCFDDVTEYMNQLAEAGTSLDELMRYTVVHGVVVASDGHRFAHAWLELDGETIESGIYNGERVWVSMSRTEFDATHDLAEETRYTIREAVALDGEHGPGPWKPEYRALCSDSRKVRRSSSPEEEAGEVTP